MWREGFELAALSWTLSALALAFGAALGLRALIDPRWAQRFVRLQPDEQGGGFAEFRSTFGGLVFALHAAAFWFALNWVMNGDFVVGVFAAGASAAVAAGWGGAAAGRIVSMLADAGTRTKFNVRSAAVEGLLALVIGGPWLAWMLAA